MQFISEEMHPSTAMREACPSGQPDQQGSAEQCSHITSEALPPESPNIACGIVELNTSSRNPRPTYSLEIRDG